MYKQYRKTYAEINISNLINNFDEIQKRVYPKKVIPVVKANAYGHGDVEVTKALVNHGVDHFAVSLLEEALKLRQEFPDITLLVMGVTHPEDLLDASKNTITITVSNYNQVEALLDFTQEITIHLKVDTGMNRLGFKDVDEFQHVITVLQKKKNITIEGLYTHFSTADCDKDYYDMQKKRFDEIVKMNLYPFDMIHVSNSSSSIKYEQEIPYTTHVRLGISLYGLTLDEGVDFLSNTYRLVTHIAEIKHLEPGEKVGYSATYQATEKEIIGVLPLGYADGFIRKNQGGFVEINNQLYPIIGRICMDQCFVKIDPSITKQDEVIIMGGLVHIDDVATRLDTINYEVICQITSRVPKVYRKE